MEIIKHTNLTLNAFNTDWIIEVIDNSAVYTSLSK